MNQEDKAAKATEAKWRKLLALAVIALVLALAIFIAISWERVAKLETYGYAGVFVISLLSSATIFIPSPGLAVVFVMGGLLSHPALVGLLAGAAEPIGELTGYVAGSAGRMAVENSQRPIYAKLDGWMQRRGALVIFLGSSFPNPVFDLIGTIAGAFRYPLWRFFLLCWAGKTIKNLMIAYAGAYGFQLVLRWLEPLRG